jgi:nucleoside-diphosphate-sugar epimerase
MAPWPAEYESVETGDYFFDASEAERVLGWRATTSLAEGLRATVDSVRTAV